jgi:hypothetical protein
MKEMTADAEMAGRDRLITNLNYATIARGGQPIRTMVHAILLQAREPLFRGQGRPQVVTGFGPDVAWQVFDLWLGCGRLEYETASYDSPDLFIGHTGEAKPLTQGAILRWADGTTIQLDVQDDKRPLDIVDVPTSQVADVLAVKTASYWVEPNMPTLRWQPAGAVRRHLGTPDPGAVLRG